MRIYDGDVIAAMIIGGGTALFIAFALGLALISFITNGAFP
jgi:hypothetical protein